LTYNKQGPSETVIHGRTGWLVQDDDEMVETAEKLWKNGYNHHVRLSCAEAASKFNKERYVERWLNLILRGA
ncbi:MAG: hypothetical protein QW701_07050, partial [Candidatus Nezhaarchaeales archaeon]